MEFYEILDQVIDLLKQRGRVTYRALKRQFNLDDDFIADLKEEIIDAQRAAIEEDGRILVWTGETEATPVTPSQPIQPQPQPVVEQAQPVQETSSSVEPHTPDAERRQLTVMFIDLVESTALSGELDPEDYREVVRQYQQICSEVTQRYDGYVAQLLGDGLLVYFGYPQAHEDDAQRAVRTGLGIVEAIRSLNTRLEQDKGIELAVRLGVHTGPVVVGEMGGVGRQERLALGETPNVAARIQGLAEPDTLIVSEATYRLIQGYFDCDALGEHALRGVTQPINVYRVLQESGAQSRLDIASIRGLTPLVGRESEVHLLLDRWNQAKSGIGQIVLLNGEPGLGKSRLVQTLKEYIANESHIWLECRSSPYHQNTALYSVIDLIQHTLLKWEQNESAEEKLSRLEQALSQYRLPVEETVPLMAGLLSLSLPEDRYSSLNLTPQRQRQKTLETIVAIILEWAEREPVLFILEDLHWTDPSTIELLGLLIEQTPTSRLYALLTCRPEFASPFGNRSYLTQITLNRLAHNDIAHMVHRITDEKPIPGEVVHQIVEKTDGVPLFIEEMTKSVLESGLLKEFDDRYELVGAVSSLAIPSTLQDSLMARLDRLVTAKAVAQYAAVIGRQFAYDVLSMVSQLDDATLQRELGRLVEAEIVYQRGLPPQAAYTFKHALIQETAYASLLKSTRQHYHQRIGQVLEAQFPETVEGQPELLAHHYTEAGLTEKAVHYWHHAGQRAIERSAHVEAIAHLRQGLALLQTLPETPQRLQHEVDLLIALGTSLRTAEGGAALEVGETYMRARQLCQHLDNPHHLFPVLRGLCIYYYQHAELQTAQALGEQLLTLAQQVQDAAMLVAAHRVLGTTLLFLGAPADAHTHFTQGIALYDLHKHRASTLLYGEDTDVSCRSYDSWTLWYLGYPDQGLTRIDESVTLAQQIAHPYSLSFVLAHSAMFHQCRREVRVVQERAEATTTFATAQGFPFWNAHGAIQRGWALAHQAQAQEGMAQIHQGLRALSAIGAELLRPYFLALLAEAHGTMGQPEAGLTALAEALTLVDNTGERWYEAELHRLKGALLLQQSLDHQTEAETCFHQALDVAQAQQAKSLELRAATSLARLWQSQEKRDEARELLAPVYSWFTEGFDTADLKDAKALLNELSGSVLKVEMATITPPGQRHTD